MLLLVRPHLLQVPGDERDVAVREAVLRGLFHHAPPGAWSRRGPEIARPPLHRRDRASAAIGSLALIAAAYA